MKTTYKDIDLRMLAQPYTGDLTTLDDDLSIMNSIRNLILLNKGERHFHPEISSNIASLLFEEMDFLVLDALSQKVLSVINKYEPRVKNLAILSSKPFENSVSLKIAFTPTKSNERKTFDLLIQKNR